MNRRRARRACLQEVRGAVDGVADWKAGRDHGAPRHQRDGGAGEQRAQVEGAARRAGGEIPRGSRAGEGGEERAVGEELDPASARAGRGAQRLEHLGARVGGGCVGEDRRARDRALGERDRGSGQPREPDRGGHQHREEPLLAPGDRGRAPRRARRRSGASREPRQRREEPRDLAPVARAGPLVLGQEARDERLDGLGHGRLELADVRRLLEEDLGQQGRQVLGHEGRAAGEALEQHRAQREQVGAGVEVGRAAGLLRRHVRRRPQHQPGLRHPVRGLPALGDAEVEEADPVDAPVDEEDVARLHVPVNDPAGVRGAERLRDARGEGDAVAQRELAFGEVGVEVVPLQPLHGEVGVPGRRAPVRHVADDAGVRDLRQERSLAEEAIRLGGPLGAQHLEGDGVPRVPVLRPEDLAHPARAGDALDLEPPGDELTWLHAPRFAPFRRDR